VSELDERIERVRRRHELALQVHALPLLEQVREIEHRVFERMKAEGERAILARLDSLGREPSPTEIQAASQVGHTVKVDAYDPAERELIMRMGERASQVFSATAALECTPGQEEGSTSPVGRIYLARATNATDGRASLLNLTMLRRTIERSESVRRALPSAPVSVASEEAEEAAEADEGPTGCAPLRQNVTIEIMKRTNKLARHDYASVRVDGVLRRDLLTVPQARALLDDAKGKRAGKDLLSRGRKRLHDEGIDPRSVKVRETRERSRSQGNASPKIRARSR